MALNDGWSIALFLFPQCEVVVCYFDCSIFLTFNTAMPIHAHTNYFGHLSQIITKTLGSIKRGRKNR